MAGFMYLGLVYQDVCIEVLCPKMYVFRLSVFFFPHKIIVFSVSVPRCIFSGLVSQYVCIQG